MWIIPLITTCVRHFDPWSGNFQNPHVLGDSKCKGSHGRDVCVSCNMIQKLQKIALLHRSCTFRLWWGTRSFPRLAERKEETVCMVHRGVSPSLGLPHIKCAFNAFCSCNTYKMNRYPPPTNVKRSKSQWGPRRGSMEALLIKGKICGLFYALSDFRLWD